MIEWRIYYGDGSVADNIIGKPSSCCNINVQAIVTRDDKSGNSIWYGFDFYIYSSGGWIGVKDTASLIDHVLHNLKNIEVVKQGRTIPDDHWKTIFGRAMNDPAFPSTSRAKKTTRG
jgi:hypothetical protein